MDSSQDVVAVSEEILVPPETLPSPGGQITRQKLRPGDVVFVMKHSYQYPWKKGMVVNILKDKGVSFLVEVLSMCNRVFNIGSDCSSSTNIK